MTSHPHRLVGCWLAVVTFILLALCGTVPVVAQNNTAAMNMSNIQDWGGVIYADALKQNRPWNRADGSRAIVNAFGQPTESASSYITDSMALRAGTYRFYHDGDLSISLPGGTMSAFTTDPVTGLQTATWVTTQRRTGVQITVSNVVTPPTVFALMRPIAEGSAVSHDLTELPDRVMVDRLGPTSVIRYMDPLETNGSINALWEHRVRPYEHPRTEHEEGGQGMPWEHIIAISNQTGTSPWICLPHMADDDYVRNVARVFRYGSDGVDPFPSDAAREAHRVGGGTVWEPLDPALQVYTEYSNEVWNSNAAFGQTPWVQSAALAEVNANPASALLYDNVDPGSGNFARIVMARYYTRRAVFISNAFREAFGDAAMMTRVRPLLFWQQTNANSHGSYRLAFLQDYFGQVRPGNPVARPPNHYIWGAGAASYYSPGPDSSDTSGGWDGVKDLVWNSGDFNAQTWTSRLVTDGGLARGHGLRYVTYEGGPGLGDPLGGLGTVHPYATEIINDPRIKDEIYEHQTIFNQYGGDLFTYFTHQGGINSVRWGFVLHLDDPVMPKLEAYQNLVNLPRETETFGKLLPVSIAAQDFSVNGRVAASARAPNPTSVDPLTLEDGSFVVYDVQAPTTGAYQIVINRASGGTAAQIAVSVDGVLVDIVSGAGTGASDPVIVEIPAERRIGVRLAAFGANCSIASLDITATTAVAPTKLLLPMTGAVFAPLQNVVALGAGRNLSWSVTGDVTASGTGPELTFNTPAVGSSFTITLTGDNGTATATYNIVDLVPVIDTTTLPDGATGTIYGELLGASNADSELTWFLVAGALPPGLLLDSSGAVAGTPQQVGSYSFTLQVSDANGDTDTQAYTVAITAPTDIRNAIDDAIVLEAEHGAFDAATDWEFAFDAGASGTDATNYITETDFSQFGTTPSPDTPSRYATYRFNATSAGTYRLYVRMRVPVSGNSLLWRVNGGTWKAMNDLGGGPNWSWVTGNSQSVPIAAGTNLLEVTSREINTELDKFILQLDGNPAPTGSGPTESPLATAGAPPVAPTGLAATGGAGQIGLTWNAVSGATGYAVKRSTLATGPFNLVATGLTGTSYTDTGLADDTTFYYAVAANNAVGSSPNSASTSATTDPTDPTLTRLLSPAAGVTFRPFEEVTLAGSGLNLSWSVTGAVTASGTGETLVITVPVNAIGGTTVDATLTGDVGTETRSWTIVDLQPTVTTTTLADGLLNSAYSANLQASSGDTPLVWSLDAGALPAGVTLSTAGDLAGTPTASGTFNFTAAVTDADGDTATQSLALTIAASPPPTAITAPAAGVTFSPLQSVTVSGTGIDLVWSLSGAVTASGSGGSLNFTVPVGATNGETVVATLTGIGGTDTRTWNIVDLLPSISPAALPDGELGVAYPATTLAAGGGDGALLWSVAGGALPGGMSLNAAGVVSGTPNAGGSFTFTAQVIDADGDVATENFTVFIDAPLQPVVLLGWDFDDAVDKAATGALSTVNDANVLPAGIVAGPGLLYSANANGNKDAYPVNRIDGTAFDATDYIAWSVIAQPDTVLSLTRVRFGLWHNDNTVGTVLGAELRVSTDGFATHTVVPLDPSPATVLQTNLNYATATDMDLDLSGIAGLQQLVDANVEFRLYLWGLGTQFKLSGVGKLGAGGAGLGLSVEGFADALVPTSIDTPAEGATFAPLETVTLVGSGDNLNWSVSGALTTSGAGSELSFSVPMAATNGDVVTATLTGLAGTATRTWSIVDSLPAITTTALPSVEAGTPYPVTPVEANGGDGTLAWNLGAGALPPGLSLSASGVLTGTPSTAGTYSFTLAVTDADGDADSAAQEIVVTAPATLVTTVETFDTATLNTGSFVSGNFSGQGGLTWDYVGTRASQLTGVAARLQRTSLGGGHVATTLANGLRAVSVRIASGISSSTASAAIRINGEVIATSPLVAFSMPYVLEVTGLNIAGPVTVQIENAGDVVVRIDDIALTYPDGGTSLQSQTIDFPNPGNRTVGDPAFTLNATASSGLPVSYAVVSGPVLLNGDTVTITGDGTATLRATQDGDAVFAPADPVDVSFVIAPYVVPTAIVGPGSGETFSPLQEVTLTGDGENLAWSVTGAASASGNGASLTFTVPAGVADGSTITATLNGANGSDNRTWSVVDLVPTITTESLPVAVIGEPYLPLFLDAVLGDGALLWTVSVGALPDGLSLSPAGELTGTPTTLGEVTFTIEVLDADGDSDAVEFTLAVVEPSVPVTLLGWDFADTTDKAVTGVASTVNDPAVNVSAVTSGSGVAFDANAFGNIDAVSTTGIEAPTLVLSDYFAWTLTPNGSDPVSLTRVAFGLWHGDNTVGSFMQAELRVSTDDFATHTVLPLSVDPTTIPRTNLSYGTGTLVDADLSGLAALQDLNSGTVEFRLYFWGLSTAFKRAGIGKLSADGNGLSLWIEGTLPAGSQPLAQAISFPAIGDRTYGDPAVVLTATTDSGLAVSYEVVSGPGALDGNTLALTGAGTVVLRAYQLGNDDYLPADPIERSFTVDPAAAAISFGELATVYSGAPQAAPFTTVPTGLAVTVYYPGLAGPPTNAGSYTVAVTVDDPNYMGSATAAWVIAPAPATIALGGLETTYDGAPQALTVSTTPAGLSVLVAYGGGAAPTDAGTYAVLATVSDPNYIGSTEAVLTVARAAQVLVVPGIADATFGDAPLNLSVSSSAGLPVTLDVVNGPVTLIGSSLTLDGAGPVLVRATQSGSANYLPADPVEIAFTIDPAAAILQFAGLVQAYDGEPRPVTVLTEPTGLPVTVTYNGAPQVPTLPGSYTVEASIDDPNYSGAATDQLDVTITALTRHAPVLNGLLDGSIQVLNAESVTLNGSATVAGDLLVPGTPALTLNGQPTFGGVLDAGGAPAPSTHRITLNGGAVLRQLVRQVDPLTLPTLAPITATTNTRDAVLNNANQSPGDFATLRHLTLNGNAGTRAVPPGVYGRLTANGNSGFILGDLNATEPAVYEVQGLTLNGNSTVQIVGPVVLRIAGTVNLNGPLGDAAHPERLLVEIVGGGLTLNGNSALHGWLTAPDGTLTINGSATVTGEVIVDRLVINGQGALVAPTGL